MGGGRASLRYRSTETLGAEGGEAWTRFLADPIGYLGGDPAKFRQGVVAALDATVAGQPTTARVAVSRPADQHLPVNALGIDGVTRILVGYGSMTRLRHFADRRHGVASINETGHHQWTT